MSTAEAEEDSLVLHTCLNILDDSCSLAYFGKFQSFLDLHCVFADKVQADFSWAVAAQQVAISLNPSHTIEIANRFWDTHGCYFFLTRLEFIKMKSNWMPDGIIDYLSLDGVDGYLIRRLEFAEFMIGLDLNLVEFDALWKEEYEVSFAYLADFSEGLLFVEIVVKTMLDFGGRSGVDLYNSKQVELLVEDCDMSVVQQNENAFCVGTMPHFDVQEGWKTIFDS